MQRSPDPRRPVGYVVSTWPRLSQTFVLNEIVALERLGLTVVIFSVKEPGAEPIHGKVNEVHAPVAYLTWKRNARRILGANLRLVCTRPRSYFSALSIALRHRRIGVVRRFFQAAYLADLLRREPVAHLHAHFATAPALVAMFAGKLLGVAFTFTAHARDIYVDTRPELLRTQMQRAKAVVTVSEYNRQYLSRHLGPSSNGKVRCIYNGLDLSQFQFRPVGISGSAPPLILCVSRLVEKKGVRDLIAAAAILKDRGCRFRMEILGDGPLRSALEAQLNRLNLQHEVKFLGPQPQEIVCSAYHRASAFALPCTITAEGDRDGIPTVLLEAMASGVPVVSTPVSGIPELIDQERDGLLVPPNNPAMLAEALHRILFDAELQERLACAARVKIESRFTIDRSAKQLLALYALGSTA